MGKPLLSRSSKCLVGGDTAERKRAVRRQHLKFRKSGVGLGVGRVLGGVGEVSPRRYHPEPMREKRGCFSQLQNPKVKIYREFPQSHSKWDPVEGQGSWPPQAWGARHLEGPGLRAGSAGVGTPQQGLLEGLQDPR